MMDRGSRQDGPAAGGLLQIEDCLDSEGGIEMPPGMTLSSLIERNIAFVGDSVAYRYLDHAKSWGSSPSSPGRNWAFGSAPSARGCNGSRPAETAWQCSRRKASTTSLDFLP